MKNPAVSFLKWEMISPMALRKTELYSKKYKNDLYNYIYIHKHILNSKSSLMKGTAKHRKKKKNS